MWARGLDDRPATRHLRAAGRARSGRSRRSCIPGPSPLEFTAPNLQYLMDSPVGVRAGRRSAQFTVGGAHVPLRAAPHRHRRRARRARAGRREDRPRSRARSSASTRPTSRAPTRSSPTTCRTPSGDGMEHRNSTVITSSGSIAADRTRPARHRRARVLPRLERRAHPPAVARAVRLRARQHLGRAVARRRVHAVLRAADAAAAPASPIVARHGADLRRPDRQRSR